MKRSSIALLIMVCLAGCKKETDSTSATAKPSCDTLTKKGDGLVMYEMSEMAALMEQMYVDNKRLKDRIIAGDTIGTFPQHFLRIHRSVMTDESENDSFFKERAARFIKAQELIYKDTLNAKQHFNDAVSACVQCHEQKCGGPIPRIKKLYIN